MAGIILRGKVYYAVFYVGQKQKRVSLETSSLQLAKEKLRQLESSLYRGNDNPLPTKTPIATVVTKYIEYMATHKTTRSMQRDVSYLRKTFGPICTALALKNPKVSTKREKQLTGHPPTYLEANYFEQITTADIANFIAAQVRRKALTPKTANRYREILTRLFNWAMEQNGIRVANDKNPASKVERYRERAPHITFLKLEQIDGQLTALAEYPQLQTMVAVYIYAGLRREELCWLTVDDIDFSAGGYGMIRIRAKTILGKFWEPKTKNNRAVPISSSLRTYLGRHQPVAEVKGKWYFSTPLGCRWDPDNLSRALREANEKAGLDWTCLDFRHTFGSHLAMRGESLYKISAIMGNSPEICRRHYAALMPESLVSSVEFGPAQLVQPPHIVTPLTMEEVAERPRLRLVVNNR